MVVITPSPPDNEAIRELRDELKDLNSSLKKSAKITEFFTVMLLLVAIVQLLAAGFQIILSTASDNRPNIIALGIFMVVSIGVVLVIFFRQTEKIYNPSGKDDTKKE